MSTPRCEKTCDKWRLSNGKLNAESPFRTFGQFVCTWTSASVSNVEFDGKKSSSFPEWSSSCQIFRRSWDQYFKSFFAEIYEALNYGRIWKRFQATYGFVITIKVTQQFGRLLKSNFAKHFGTLPLKVCFSNLRFRCKYAPKLIPSTLNHASKPSHNSLVRGQQKFYNISPWSAMGKTCPSVVNKYFSPNRLIGLSTSNSKKRYLHVSERKNDSWRSSSDLSSTSWTVA